ncbi:hypothetical protein CIK02_24050 [Pseudomonas putida]|nr:hypothetical protein CIK02_24050 [Pseudomonas putida]
MPQFSHHDLQLLTPSFDSPLVDVLAELEFLRRLRLEGDDGFFQAESSSQTAKSCLVLNPRCS